MGIYRYGCFHQPDSRVSMTVLNSHPGRMLLLSIGELVPGSVILEPVLRAKDESKGYSRPRALGTTIKHRGHTVCQGHLEPLSSSEVIQSVKDTWNHYQTRKSYSRSRTPGTTIKHRGHTDGQGYMKPLSSTEVIQSVRGLLAAVKEEVYYEISLQQQDTY